MEVKKSVTRWVFITDKWAVKIPALWNWRQVLYGLIANIRERERSVLKDPRLCPMVWSCPGGFLNVMQRVTPLTAEDEPWLKEVLKRGEFSEFWDKKWQNFGKLDGNLVLIDYG
jgi:hypothetical protein